MSGTTSPASLRRQDTAQQEGGDDGDKQQAPQWQQKAGGAQTSPRARPAGAAAAARDGGEGGTRAASRAADRLVTSDTEASLEPPSKRQRSAEPQVAQPPPPPASLPQPQPQPPAGAQLPDGVDAREVVGSRGEFRVEAVGAALHVTVQLAGREWTGLLFCPAPGFLGATAADAPGDPASPALPPKRPRTAFNYFSDAVRPGVREQHPLVDPKGISKLVGEAWSALPLGERQPYVEAAAADKERFEREMAEHQARHLRGPRRELRHAVAPMLAGEQQAPPLPPQPVAPPQPQQQQSQQAPPAVRPSHQQHSSQAATGTAAAGSAAWAAALGRGLSGQPPAQTLAPVVPTGAPWPGRGSGLSGHELPGAGISRGASATSQPSASGGAPAAQQQWQQQPQQQPSLLPSSRAALAPRPAGQPGMAGSQLTAAQQLAALLQQPGLQVQPAPTAQQASPGGAPQDAALAAQLVNALLSVGAAPSAPAPAPPSAAQLSSSELLALLLQAANQPPDRSNQ